jgi:exosome complex component RRP41
MPIALMPNTGKITLLQMDGDLSTEEFNTAIEMAVEACKKIGQMQRESIKRKYLQGDKIA